MRRSALSLQMSTSQTSGTISKFVHLERESTLSLHRQISQGIREAIAKGELPAGAQLPSERVLAKELGVNRTTVMNAYNELVSEGLVERHVGRGTHIRPAHLSYEEVMHDLHTPSWLLGLAPLHYPQDETFQTTGYYLLRKEHTMVESEIISFIQAAPALEMFPTGYIRTLVNDTLMEKQQSALGYGPVKGLQSLRRGISEHMRKRGVAIDSNNILILSGSTQGIGLIGRFLLNPGDEVIVEIPTYPGATQTFRELGARIIGIPTDSEGMRVDLLETILARHQPRLIYTLPTFQNPTGAVMSADRRRRLLQLAHRYQVPILEDDAYSEIYFEGDEPQPLKALDTYGHVLYLSTYSKTLAPGLRVAWLVASEPVIERLSLHKQIFDLNTNAFGQWIVSEMLERNMFNDHLAIIRQAYKHKRDVMLQAIQDYWPQEIHMSKPAGGFHLWCHLPARMRTSTLLREAIQAQVIFLNGDLFHVDGGGKHTLRLSFSALTPAQIVEGIQRLGTSMQRILQARNSASDQGPDTVEHMPMI